MYRILKQIGAVLLNRIACSLHILAGEDTSLEIASSPAEDSFPDQKNDSVLKARRQPLRGLDDCLGEAHLSTHSEGLKKERPQACSWCCG